MRQLNMEKFSNTNVLFPEFDTRGDYEDFPCAVFELNQDRRVTLTNSTADAILHHNDGIYLLDSALQFNDPVVMHEYELLLNACSDNTCHSQIKKHRFLPVKRKNRNMPYQLMVIPVGDYNPAQKIIVLIHDPVEQSTLRATLLASAYDLTDTEISLCRLFYAGKSMQEICDVMGIKANTGKTHFRHIFDKCQVSSRIELMRLLSCFNGASYLTS